MKVSVKWNKELFKDVEVDIDQPPVIFKSQLYSLTGVPPDRQKILVKGGVLQDDEWGKAKPKEGQTLMMMGTVEQLKEPVTEIKFIEDVIPEDEQQHVDTRQYGAGLENLGNTCYMNSTLQCLYSVQELRTALENEGTNLPATSLPRQVDSTFQALTRQGAPYRPMFVWNALKTYYPQFSQVQNGMYMQQDAQECWSTIINEIKGRVKVKEGESEQAVVDKVFGIQFEKILKNEESGEEIKEVESDVLLKCNIEQEVDYLSQGIELGLKADREQISTKLGQSVVFSGKATITRLPPYLTIQMVRFFFKQSSQQKAKILRKVTFPLHLDVYPYCSDALKAQLDKPRAAKKILDDRKFTQTHPGIKAPPATQPEEGSSMDVDGGAQITVDNPEAFSGQHTGRYNLQAVLTHKGRSADSGHYVAWVRQQDGVWVEFDDDNLILRKDEDILQLSGGGDWHMAYLMIYKEEIVPNGEQKVEEKKDDEAEPMEVQ